MTALNEKAVLISVSTKSWRATIKNKQATCDLAADKGTTEEWVNVTQRIVPKAVVQEPQRIAAACKNYLRGDSPGAFDGEYLRGGLPLWDKNVHILPNGLSEKLLRNLGAFQEQFNEAVENVRKVLPNALRQAAIENPELAPQIAVPDVDYICEEKYGLDWELNIMPSSNDIRIDSSKEFAAEVKRSIEEKANRKLKEVTDHTVKAVIKVASHLAKSCEDYDPEQKGKSPFRDSAINQVRELIPVIRGLNINSDAAIDKAATDLLAAVGNKSADELRKDDDSRKSVATKARQVASNLDQLFN